MKLWYELQNNNAVYQNVVMVCIENISMWGLAYEK